MKLIKGKIYRIKGIQGYIRGVYMGVMNVEMTFCDISFKGGMLYYVTKEDIDNGDVEEEIRIFKIKDKEDCHLK